ncbi:transcriptional regulator, LacI family [Micrococcales bacterium KH10]|nr:transcriptional regulator, LacI family [Micrococcales bacterium KH10]
MERRPPTLEEVAIAAGVSRSTASRVINGAVRVAPATQRAVEYAIERLGYVPNQAARSLVTRRTHSIALIIPEDDGRILSDPFLGQAVSGVNNTAADAGIQLVLLIGNHAEDRIQRIGQYLRGGHVDGTIVVSHHRDDGLEEVLASTRIPSYFVGRPIQPQPGLRYVDVNNVRGAEIATQHLVDRGARRIATITGPLDMAAGVDRLEGWRKTVQAAGLPDDLVAHGDFTVGGGSRAMAELLDRDGSIDAVFAASDQLAAGALQVLATRGIKVPDQISVVGFDNLGFAQNTIPQLTTVQNPVKEMATLATEHLLKRIEDPDAEYDSDRIAIIEPTFVPGKSA